VAYWAVAQLQPNRTALALRMLPQEGFTVYAPKLRERRTIRGRREDSEVALFPGYAFVAIALQWHAARWCPGVIRLVMDGLQPAKVRDAVIEEIRARERNGAIELPKRDAPDFVEVGEAGIAVDDAMRRQRRVQLVG
jgi:transcription antitermination factor NusG